MRPALRYLGGKWKLAPWIISQFPPHHIYTEAFGGAASVLLRKPRCRAEVYNDLDGEVVNLFRVLRNPAQARELVRLVSFTPFAREEFELSCLPDGDPIEQARRTVARSFMGFGSNAVQVGSTGFRSNTSRKGSTPAGDWTGTPRALEEIADRFRGVVIENIPAMELLAKHDHQDALHYVDPPYPHATRKEKRYRFEMSDVDHRELAALLCTLRGKVLVSGYACPLYDELFAGWKVVSRTTFADGALPRTEVLWIRPDAVVQAGLFTAEMPGGRDDDGHPE